MYPASRGELQSVFPGPSSPCLFVAEFGILRSFILSHSVVSRRTSNHPAWVKYFIVIGIAAVLLLSLISALGMFDDDLYTAVPHGNHVHYVPKDRDPSVPLHNFPQELPPPGMKIASDGSIVPE